MDNNILVNQITGLWITQSSHYYLQKNSSLFSKTLMNKAKWSDISNNSYYTNILRQKLKKEYKIKSIVLYKIQFLDTNYRNHTQYILLLKDQLDQTYLLKFNQSLAIVNKFIVKESSCDYLCLISHKHNLGIIQRIYFLNKNLKIIKSTVTKSNKYIATFFSSEIKIN